MGNIIVIFGTLIALNLGFGFWLSDKNADSQTQSVVEVEDVQAAAPADQVPKESEEEESK